PTGLLETTFHRGDLSAELRWRALRVEAGLTLGFDRVGLDGEQYEQRIFGIMMERTLAAGRVRASIPLGDFTLSGGADVEHQRARSAAFGKRTDVPDERVDLIRPEVQALL